MKLRKLLAEEDRAVFLLVSVLLFILLTPLLETQRVGQGFIVASMYLTLIAATVELSEKRVLLWVAIPLAGSSMMLMLANHVLLYRIRWLTLASGLALGLFLSLVSAALFVFLGRPGTITRRTLLVSVTLYFLLALSWYVLYGLLDVIQPGSFAEVGMPLLGRIAPSKLLYFSLASLTTLGYGDIVAIRPLARIIATLEAAAGVLYIAITVARLVSSYQISREK